MSGAELPYETTDPTIDSQIVNLKASGADVFFNVTTPKFAAQAIKKVGEIGWKPLHLLNNVSNSPGAVLKPAGLERSEEHTSELQSLMRSSYAVFCLKKKTKNKNLQT